MDKMHQLINRLSLVRESEVPKFQETRELFRVLNKGSVECLEGFALALDPDDLEDVVPEEYLGNPESLDTIIPKIQKLYQTSIDGYLKAFYAVSGEEVYQHLRTEFASDAAIVTHFNNSRLKTVETPEPPETFKPVFAAPKEEQIPEPVISPVSVKRPEREVHIMMEPTTPVLKLDYDKLGQIVKAVLVQELGELSNNVRGDLSAYEAGINAVIKTLEKVAQDRDSVINLAKSLMDATTQHQQATTDLDRLIQVMNKQSQLFDMVISRYSSVGILVNDNAFEDALNNLDKIANPSMFLRAVKSVLKEHWYSGDREFVEKFLVQALDKMKEGR